MAKWVDEGETRVAQILFGSQAVDATLYLGLVYKYNRTSRDSESGGDHRTQR